MTETFNLSIEDIVAAVRQRVGRDKGRASSIADTKARLAPCEAVVRDEIDLDMIAGHPARGRAARIAKRIKFNPQVKAYRDCIQQQRVERGRPFQPDTQHALTQWTARILDRLAKLNTSPSAG
jgi:hypothetical protein